MTSTTDTEPRVLAISSHVVRGYVGNRCIALPLQTLGVEVDFVNSVQFSNHTQYKNGWKGTAMDGEGLTDLIDGLEANSLLDQSHLITGYVGTASFLRSLIAVKERLRQFNPDVQWVCDPVMGDHGHVYTPPELLPVYQEEVVPNADVLLPNQFEAELLTGLEIKDEEGAAAACEKLHEMGPHTVILSSCAFEGKTDTVSMFFSRRNKDGSTTKFSITVPYIEREGRPFVGTGDLFSALTVAWTLRLPDDPVTAMTNVMASMQGVLQRTLADGTYEIRLVQALSAIIEPPALSGHVSGVSAGEGVDATDAE